MNNRVRVQGALAGSAGLGVLSDVLLRAPGAPALNAALLSGGGLLLVGWLVLRRDWPRTRESAWLLLIAFLFVCALAWRGAESLHALNILAALTAASLAAGATGYPWVRRSAVSAYAQAAVRSAVSLAGGPLTLISALGPRETTVGVTARIWRRHGVAALRGALLAVPLLLVFGGLLGAADPVFARLLTGTFRFDAELVLSHVLLTGVFAWWSAGYLSNYLAPSRLATFTVPIPQPRIGIVDGAVALGLLNALFLAFVVVQLRYLFGGAGIIEITPGLGYAEYARRGFFELVTVAGLVVPVLLLADWSVARTRPRDEWTFRGFCLLQLLLLFAIIASAVHRMRLYQEAYGLTELRLYTTVFMAWIAVVLGWLAVTVLRGRRRHFAFGALIAGLLAVATLNLLNPHALIVRVNAARVAAGHGYDAPYAGRLSADAVPALLEVLPRLPLAQRCEIAARLHQEYQGAQQADWRTWNYARQRARRAVAGAGSGWTGMCPDIATAASVAQPSLSAAARATRVP